MIPARRGRGGSEGEYDEGFATDRSAGYTCEASLSIAGADRALRDIEAALDAILAMPFVDKNRVVIGGQSRGALYPEDTIWLYGDADPFYPLSHSRDNFVVFQKAGGKGAFHALVPPPGTIGHRIVERGELWAPLVEAYLKHQGLASEER